ncbi:COMM domain-containing protein 7 isoform X3 [Ictidomys tridecemlineatus]
MHPSSLWAWAVEKVQELCMPASQSRGPRWRKAEGPALRPQQFSALTEVIFHFLIEPKEVERFLAQLSEFATTNQISLGPLRSIVKSLLLVPNGALKRSLTAEQVRADFLTLGLSEEKATYFSEKLKLVVKKGNQTENVYLELTLPQFYSFLHEMERARASMECLS